MCAIVDTNVAGEVFGSDRTEAGQKFFEWINTGHGRLAIGGGLRDELNCNSAFVTWAKRAANYGRLIEANDSAVGKRTAQILAEQKHKSDDPHVLALAQISGARLLYSNDGDLQKDFRTRRFLNNPRGSVYTTRIHSDFRVSHKKLLSRKDLCRVRQ